MKPVLLENLTDYDFRLVCEELSIFVIDTVVYQNCNTIVLAVNGLEEATTETLTSLYDEAINNNQDQFDLDAEIKLFETISQELK